MTCYLGLGSNLGDRRAYLESALQALQSVGTQLRVSSLYETPALLPAHAERDWNKPFLNLVAQLECELAPSTLLERVKKIETEMGRQAHAKWAPREIDIDILIYGNTPFHSDQLTLPHPHLHQRAFVLDPLKDLAPSLRLPQLGGQTVLDTARVQSGHAPVWAAILNITPDSFSDGGRYDHESHLGPYLEELDLDSIGILDIGAESTRPGAVPVPPEVEWSRLEPVLHLMRERYKGRRLRPLISVDTRHFEVATRAVDLDVDILNDVSGLADPRFLELLAGTKCQYVLMHSLSIPADPAVTLADPSQVVREVSAWFTAKLEVLTRAGVDRDRVILDPGIGFGKDRLQSLRLLQDVNEFYQLGCRVMIGHSRKSFLADFAPTQPDARDIESAGVSLALIQNGVDILRVHNPAMHIRALRGFSHARRQEKP